MPNQAFITLRNYYLTKAKVKELRTLAQLRNTSKNMRTLVNIDNTVKIFIKYNTALKTIEGLFQYGNNRSTTGNNR